MYNDAIKLGGDIVRLGFACKVLGADIPSHDTRRWQSKPHLSVSIGYLHRMFDYLRQNHIDMYRISSDVAPYFTDPQRPEFGTQLMDCASELEELGQKALQLDLRLSTHPGQYVVLNSVDERVYQAAVRDLEYHAELLDRMAQPASAKMVVHVGGVYGDSSSSMDRWMRRYEILPANVRARLVIENDDKSYSIDNVLHISAKTGVPVVFDALHHAVLNPTGVSESEALAASLRTWPAGQTPKVHYSDERSEPRTVRRGGRITQAPPLRGQHAEYVSAPPFAEFLRRNRSSQDFDVMIEAKAKDLALLQLRDDLRHMGVHLSAA